MTSNLDATYSVNENDDDVLISVKGVSKKFCRSLKRSLWYGLQDISSEILGKSKQHESLRKDEFWAVKDVSFEVRRGECLGLIGPNGAGKSTLLKLLTGIIKPDMGEIRIKGRVGALIELGAGFHPILTGRENIYINGTILGLTKKEINEKFEQIIDFADIGDFLDTPVQNYSSGMRVRLGFAIAAHLNPDVLFIDEVLAVGDAGFRGKCYNAIAQLQKKCAIIFVSHSMAAIGRICNYVTVLKQGEQLCYDSPSEGIRVYNTIFNFNKLHTVEKGASITKVSFKNSDNKETTQFEYNSEINIYIDFKIDQDLDNPIINLHFMDLGEQYVLQANSLLDNHQLNYLKKGSYSVKMRIVQLKLNPGRYSCSIVIFDKNQRQFLAWLHNCQEFDVIGNFVGACAYLEQCEWQLENIN